MLNRSLLVLASALLPYAVAQTTTGTISGKIMDVSGAAVANAKVVATELATNLSRDTTSAADGSYSLLFLPVGAYRVDVTVSGFKKLSRPVLFWSSTAMRALTPRSSLAVSAKRWRSRPMPPWWRPATLRWDSP